MIPANLFFQCSEKNLYKLRELFLFNGQNCQLSLAKTFSCERPQSLINTIKNDILFCSSLSVKVTDFVWEKLRALF